MKSAVIFLASLVCLCTASYGQNGPRGALQRNGDQSGVVGRSSPRERPGVGERPDASGAKPSTAAPRAKSRLGGFAWNPAKTWVFAVGILEWKSGKYGAFPKENRRDERLISVLKDRGVPESQITFLQDKIATTSHVQESFQEFLTKPRPGDWVFFYFTGHGYNSADHKETFLVTYDANEKLMGLAVSPIPRAINRQCKASYVILAVDNCNSGGMAEAVKNLKEPKAAFSVFTSAHWNSGSTANWTFTENLIYAFSGEPFMDDDHDGVVTFQELRANVSLDMTFAENQMPQSVTTPQFNVQWAIAEDRTPPDPTVGERGEFRSSGGWYRGFTIGHDGDKKLVRFYGYDSSCDEWVGPDAIRKPAPSEELPIGTTVSALSHNEWFSAKVVAVRQGMHLVKFDGWASEWNEWLPASSLKRK